MEWWQPAVLALVGTLAGAVNVVAGGGSLLTLPLMIFLGLDPATANGTNRVALLMQNATAVRTFRRLGLSDLRLSATMGLCTVPGAVLGAVAAVEIDPEAFRIVLAVVMVAAGVAILLPPSGRPSARRRPVLAHLAMVGVGFYGGFIQAGVGFLLMAALRRLLVLDLLRVNMHKVAVVLLYTVPSLAVFAVTGHVSWLAGLALGVGNAAGGWAGTRLQVRRGERVVRVVLVLAVAALAVRLVVR